MALEIDKTLSEKDLEDEKVFNALIDRVNKEPNDKTMEALKKAIKDADVYVPARIMLDKEEGEKLQQAIKAKQNFTPDPNKLRFSFALFENKALNAKVLPFFTMRSEANLQEGKMPKGMGLIRIPVAQAVKIADNMQDAFDIAFDPFTHMVKLTLDEVLAVFEDENQDGSES